MWWTLFVFSFSFYNFFEFSLFDAFKWMNKFVIDNYTCRFNFSRLVKEKNREKVIFKSSIFIKLQFSDMNNTRALNECINVVAYQLFNKKGFRIYHKITMIIYWPTLGIIIHFFIIYIDCTINLKGRIGFCDLSSYQCGLLLLLSHSLLFQVVNITSSGCHFWICGVW